MNHQMNIDEAIAIAKEYHLNKAYQYIIYSNNINAT